MAAITKPHQDISNIRPIIKPATAITAAIAKYLKSDFVGATTGATNSPLGISVRLRFIAPKAAVPINSGSTNSMQIRLSISPAISISLQFSLKKHRKTNMDVTTDAIYASIDRSIYPTCARLLYNRHSVRAIINTPIACAIPHKIIIPLQNDTHSAMYSAKSMMPTYVSGTSKPRIAI